MRAGAFGTEFDQRFLDGVAPISCAGGEGGSLAACHGPGAVVDRLILMGHEPDEAQGHVVISRHPEIGFGAGDAFGSDGDLPFIPVVPEQAVELAVLAAAAFEGCVHGWHLIPAGDVAGDAQMGGGEDFIDEVLHGRKGLGLLTFQ